MTQYDPMRDILDNIDKQMEAKGIILKSPPIQNGSKIPKVSIDAITEDDTKKQIPKNPRKEKSEKVSKLNGLDKYLIFSFTSIILFTIAILATFIMTGNEPAVLVGCFFAAFGGEILMCALIKKLKLHKEAEIKKEDSTWQQ